MTLKLSTGLRNKMVGLEATVSACMVGATMAFVDGGAGADSLTDTGNGFITAGFAPGDVLHVTGATTAANDSAVTGAVLTDVAAGTLTLPTGTVNTAEAFAAATVVATARGGSLCDIMKYGILRIYSGTQPADADTAASGTLLVEITVSSGAWSAGSFTNGLVLGAEASGAISKNSDVWSGVASATGTAGWFRLYANPTDAGGASTTLPRIDGSVGTSGADLNMASTALTSGATYTIDTFTVTQPAYYGA